MIDVTARASIAPRPSAEPEDGTLRLGYQPALDGLRGFGLVFVLLFHAGVDLFPGSFLAVSMFLTLSGFLITRLLMEERRGGAVSLRRFYGRRVRRLLPASLCTLLAIVVLARLGAFPSTSNLRRDVLGATLQAANWTRLTSGRSYVDLFRGPSPVEHYWSLAIEEQFYLVWPVAFVVLARRSRAALRVSLPMLFGAFAIVAGAIALVWGDDAAYLATPARVGEVLAGAALAALLDWRHPPRWLVPASIAAAVASVVLMVVTPFDHGWAYQGLLPWFGIVSALLVAGGLVDGPLRRALSWRPAVVLGTMSYGIYLVHWPVDIVVDRYAGDLGSVALFVAKIAVTFAVAIPLYHLVERPLRHRPLRPWTVPVGLGAIAAVVVIAALVVPATTPLVADADAATSAEVAIPAVHGRLPALVVDGEQARPLRVLVVGDSTARIQGAALVRWAAAHPDEMQVTSLAVDACGLVPGGVVDDLADFTRADCDRSIDHDVPNAFTRLRPDVVLVAITGADTLSRRWDDGPLRRPTDPDYHRRIDEAYDAFFARAAGAGLSHVAWVRMPRPREGVDLADQDGSGEIVDAAVARAGAQRARLVSVLDLRSWFEHSELDTATNRPDDVHLVAGAADAVTERFLVPELRRLAGL